MELSHPYTMAAVYLIWERRKFLFTASNPGQGRQWCMTAWLHCTFQFPALFSLLLSPLLGHSQTGCVWQQEAAEQAGFAEVILKNKTIQPQESPKSLFQLPTSLVFLTLCLPFSRKSSLLLLSYFVTSAWT